MYTFGPTIYDTMIDNDECWVISQDGTAMIVSDASLMDC